MNAYPSTCAFKGPLKDKDGVRLKISLTFPFCDTRTHTHDSARDARVHVGSSDVHTLRAHMLSLTLMADLPTVPSLTCTNKKKEKVQ